MGMTIDMCHDIEKYKEDVLMGFDWKKSLYFIAAVLVGAGTIFFFYKVLGWNILVSVYAMMPFAGIIVFLGFYTKNGLTFGQIIRRKVKRANVKPLEYRSTECRACYEAINLADPAFKVQTEEDKQDEINRMLKKLKIGLIAGGVVFVLLIVLIAIYV